MTPCNPTTNTLTRVTVSIFRPRVMNSEVSLICINGVIRPIISTSLLSEATVPASELTAFFPSPKGSHLMTGQVYLSDRWFALLTVHHSGNYRCPVRKCLAFLSPSEEQANETRPSVVTSKARIIREDLSRISNLPPSTGVG